MVNAPEIHIDDALSMDMLLAHGLAMAGPCAKEHDSKFQILDSKFLIPDSRF